MKLYVIPVLRCYTIIILHQLEVVKNHVTENKIVKLHVTPVLKLLQSMLHQLKVVKHHVTENKVVKPYVTPALIYYTLAYTNLEL